MKKIRRAFRRDLRREEGFTLVEVLVTIMLLIVVLFSLYSLFDASMRIFSVSNDRVEANQSSRVAMERMERELRMAFPGNLTFSDTSNYRRNLLCASGSPYCSTTVSANQVAFGNDLNADRNIQNCTSATSCSSYDADEVITYFVADVDGDGVQDLARRTRAASGTDNAAVKMVSLGTDGSFNLTYFQKDGSDADNLPDVISPPFSASSATLTEPKVIAVRIELNVRVDRAQGQGSLQKLTTDVTLRNRNR